jgi:uncharacterized heparinase superfamily protein
MSRPGYSIHSLPRLARTVRPLSVNQIVHLVRQRLSLSFRRGGTRGPVHASDVRPRADFALSAGIVNAERRLIDGCFRFINESRDIGSVIGQGWHPDAARLWRYNLHYFDFLKDTDTQTPSRDDFSLRLMASWHEHNGPDSEDAWDPYPTALRCVNWIKYLHGRRRRTADAPDWLLDSLAAQVGVLERNIEYHLRGNHLFKNIVALIFAGIFFEGRAADRWRNTGLSLLRAELGEQFLPDGGHVERTPMYHALCVEDCLDCFNVLRANPGLASADVIESLAGVIRRGLRCLLALTRPDGELAAFSDTAPGIAPTTAQLLGYASDLGIEVASLAQGDVYTISLPDSGYYGYRRGTEYLLLDCGAMGVVYQPGHGHCDLLSFEWVLAGRSLIVDSGVFDYGVTPERHFARSTAAHNTVVVDDREQGEIWGAFRLGRRPKMFSASVARDEHGNLRLAGKHDAYRHLPGGVEHRRTLTRDFSRGLVVVDELNGRGRHRATARFHFAPGCRLSRHQDVIAVCMADGTEMVRVSCSDNVTLRVGESEHYPAFGARTTVPVLELDWHGELPARWESRFDVALLDPGTG